MKGLTNDLNVTLSKLHYFMRMKKYENRCYELFKENIKVNEFTFITTVHDLTKLNEILRSHVLEKQYMSLSYCLDDFNDFEPVLQDYNSLILLYPNFERLTRHAKLNLISKNL
ncbi:MAG: hypothetical protein CfClM3_1503 [Methanobrevibacter sp. CfCl-M3]